jgi:hypothetical protein
MDLKKLAAAKTKIKKHAPELIGAGIVIITAVATLGTKHLLDSRKTELRINEDAMEWMRQEDVNMTYSADGHDYSIRYIGTTPNF